MSSSELNISRRFKVRECSWDEVWPEGWPLFQAREKEIKVVDNAAPLNLDTDRLANAYRSGILRIVGAFDHLSGRPRLCGYLFWYVSPSILSRHSIVADQGPWYVEPSLRRTPLGFRLFAESIAMLKAASVHQVLVHRSEHSPKGIEKIFCKFGGHRLEEVWEIKL